MVATPQQLFDFVEGLGIKTQTHQHPPLFTVEQSRELRGEIPGGHTKNLFLKDKKGTILLFVTLEHRDVDLKALARLAGTGRLSFGRPELLRELLGVEPGTVTPFGLINDKDTQIRVLLDEEMMAHELVNYHPLTNEATTTISPADLLAFIKACGHRPYVIALDGGG